MASGWHTIDAPHHRERKYDGVRMRCGQCGYGTERWTMGVEPLPAQGACPFCGLIMHREFIPAANDAIEPKGEPLMMPCGIAARSDSPSAEACPARAEAMPLESGFAQEMRAFLYVVKTPDGLCLKEARRPVQGRPPLEWREIGSEATDSWPGGDVVAGPFTVEGLLRRIEEDRYSVVPPRQR